MAIQELWANAETWRGGKLERCRSAPSPHFGEGRIPLLESDPLPRASPGAVLGPAPPSRSLLPFTSSLPLSLLLTPPSPDSLPAPLSFFAPDRELSGGWAGAAAPLPCPRAETPAPPSHAVRPLEELPPPARGAPGAGPGRSATCAPTPAHTPGRRHQEARPAGAEENGSVTGGGGLGGRGLSPRGAAWEAGVFRRGVPGLPRQHGLWEVCEIRNASTIPAGGRIYGQPRSSGCQDRLCFPPGGARRACWSGSSGPGARIGIPEGRKSGVGDRLGASLTRLPDTPCLLASASAQGHPGFFAALRWA